MYRKICIPLIQVNSNIYAFLSGILVSLSTNIFTSLCFEPLDLLHQWHHYLSAFFLIGSGALCMYISVKISSIQSYISNNRITTTDEIREIIKETTEERKATWVISYLLLIILTLGGFVFLGLSWVIGNGS